MIAELKAMGFRLSLWESPYVPLDSEMCAEGERRGFLLKSNSISSFRSGGDQSILPSPSGGGQGGGLALVHGFAKPSAAVDFTNPEAVEWFKAKNRRLLKMGVAVMKPDFAEDLPGDAVAHEGTPAGQLHSLYPMLYQRAGFE